MASVTLYQIPVVPTPPASTTIPAAPTATLPILRTIAPTVRPTTTRPPVGPGIGQKAPDFLLTGLDGLTYTLRVQQDQFLVLSFWASWSASCQEAWSEFLTFTAGLTGTDAVFLSVNVEEIPEIVWRFVGTTTLPFPILLDQGGYISERYQVTVLPTTFLIDPAGYVRHVLPGPVDAATLQRLIRP